MPHTPGPWKLENTLVYALHTVRGSTGHIFETIFSASVQGNGLQGASREEVEDNARLMAAAPELLEACKAVMASTYDDGESIVLKDMCMVAIPAVKAAIAKAKGR